MIYSRLTRRIVQLAALVAVVVSSVPASAEVVALRRGSGSLGLFHNDNGEISSVFSSLLQGYDAVFANGLLNTGANTITEITGPGIVEDSGLWGKADTASTGNIPGNTWDENGALGRNYGVQGNGVQGRLGLLKFNVAAAPGLIGGTVNKAELRLFFNSGNGADVDNDGVRNLSDAIGRVTSHDWVEGTKNDSHPGTGTPGVSRYHPISTNTGGHQDINNFYPGRTQGRWWDPAGAKIIDAYGPGLHQYTDFLPGDYSEADADGGGGGEIDGADLARWQTFYGTSSPPNAPNHQVKFRLGDGDIDGDIDGRDFLTWQRNFGKQGIESGPAGDTRGYFSSAALITQKYRDITYQFPTWGDGNDYFNPDPVDYTTNPTDFPLITIDGVQIYRPKGVLGGTAAAFPVSPQDGVSPGDGDVANEVDSLDATSLGAGNFDFAFDQITPTVFASGSAGFDVWDVTAMLQTIAGGGDNFGFYIRDFLRSYGFSETGHGLDFAPVLFIDYTAAPAAFSVPEPTSLLLLGLAGAAALGRRRRWVA